MKDEITLCWSPRISGCRDPKVWAPMRYRIQPVGAVNADLPYPSVHGLCTAFVFKVKWGQAESQANENTAVRVTRVNRIWMLLPSHQAFCNSENHPETTDGWRSFLGVRHNVLGWTCQVSLLPSLPHPITKANSREPLPHKGILLDYDHHFIDHRLTSVLSRFFAVKSS